MCLDTEVSTIYFVKQFCNIYLKDLENSEIVGTLKSVIVFHSSIDRLIKFIIGN